MIQKIQLNSNVTIQLSAAGEGEPVVFLHGIGGNLSFWAGQVRDVARHFRVIRYDLRGHGNSSPATGQTMLDHAGDVCALLDHFQIEQAHLVGLSMGGVIAQTFAAEFPQRLNRLVLVSTTSVFPSKGKAALHHLAALAEASGMQAVAEQFAPTVFSAPVSPDDERCQALMAAFAMQDVPSFAAAARALAEADVTEQLSAIQAPTLLCFGDKDRQTPPFLGERLAAQLPQARLHIFPNAGHVLPIEIPDEFNQVLLEFLIAGSENL